MVEGTIRKIAEGAKKDLSDRMDNWKSTLKEVKERVSLKDVGKPILFSDDTILGKHFNKAREITARTLGRR